jgi:hypothetical protein
MSSRTWTVRQVLGVAAVASLALAGFMAPGLGAMPAGSSTMTMKQDLADREKDIHWPEGFDPSQADLFSHNALVINASCDRIWGHIIDATKWPQWYPNSKDVRIDGCREIIGREREDAIGDVHVETSCLRVSRQASARYESVLRRNARVQVQLGPQTAQGGSGWAIGPCRARPWTRSRQQAFLRRR